MKKKRRARKSKGPAAKKGPGSKGAYKLKELEVDGSIDEEDYVWATTCLDKSIGITRDQLEEASIRNIRFYKEYTPRAAKNEPRNPTQKIYMTPGCKLHCSKYGHNDHHIIERFEIKAINWIPGTASVEIRMNSTCFRENKYSKEVTNPMYNPDNNDIGVVRRAERKCCPDCRNDILLEEDELYCRHHMNINDNFAAAASAEVTSTFSRNILTLL